MTTIKSFCKKKQIHNKEKEEDNFKSKALNLKEKWIYYEQQNNKNNNYLHLKKEIKKTMKMKKMKKMIVKY